MEIKFDKISRLSQMQIDFQKRFNYLKIEFFKLKKDPDAKYTGKDILNNSLRIEEVSTEFNLEPVHINGLMKVGEVEKNFSEKLGLHVQIFRKSGKVWLSTFTTDQLTLDELNSEAREKEKIKSEKAEESDYHEQE